MLLCCVLPFAISSSGFLELASLNYRKTTVSVEHLSVGLDPSPKRA